MENYNEESSKNLEEDIEESHSFLSKNTDDYQEAKFQKFQLFMFFTFLSMGSMFPCYFIGPLYFKTKGYLGLTEYTVFVRFFFVILGSLAFSVLFRKMNFRISFIIFSIGFTLIPFSYLATSFCIEHTSQIGICSLKGIYSINFIGMALSGVLGPGLLLISFVYAEVLSNGNNKARFVSVAAGMISGAPLFGTLLATLVLPLSTNFMFFAILTGINIFCTIAFGFFKDENIDHLGNRCSLWQNVKNISNEIWTSSFSKSVFLLSMLDGASVAIGSTFLYRSLNFSLQVIGNQTKREFYKGLATSFFGLTSLLSAIILGRFKGKLKNQYILYFGILTFIFSIIFMNWGYFNHGYYLVVISYSLAGITRAQIQSGINLSISRNGYNLERVSIFRLASTIATSFMGLVGMIYLNFDGILIFSIVTTLLIFISYIVIYTSSFFKED